MILHKKSVPDISKEMAEQLNGLAEELNKLASEAEVCQKFAIDLEEGISVNFDAVYSLSSELRSNLSKIKGMAEVLERMANISMRLKEREI